MVAVGRQKRQPLAAVFFSAAQEEREGEIARWRERDREAVLPWQLVAIWGCYGGVRRRKWLLFLAAILGQRKKIEREGEA